MPVLGIPKGPDLARCPHCGAFSQYRRTVVGETVGYSAGCPKCDIWTGYDTDKKISAIAWNLRIH